MAAALESAVAVTPWVVQACSNWQDSLAAGWEATHRQLVRRKQVACRTLAWVLRRPAATAIMLAGCRMLPSAARLVIAKINERPRIYA
jgi:hypothetical protein